MFIPRESIIDAFIYVVAMAENELTNNAKIEISPITKGPKVNQYMQTSILSVFACGNVVHVNDLVDNVSTESKKAGESAAAFAAGTLHTKDAVAVETGDNVRYVCPQTVVPADEKVDLYFRVMKPQKKVVITVSDGDNILLSRRLLRLIPVKWKK